MSEEETKATETPEAAPAPEEAPAAEAAGDDDKPDEEENTAHFEPVVSPTFVLIFQSRRLEHDHATMKSN
jgi:hypothetical protein